MFFFIVTNFVHCSQLLIYINSAGLENLFNRVTLSSINLKWRTSMWPHMNLIVTLSRTYQATVLTRNQI